MNGGDDEGSGEEFVSPFGTIFTKLRATRINFSADGTNRVIDIETAHGMTYKVLFNESCKMFLNGEPQTIEKGY